jgi:hypothetical protein
LTQGFTDAHRQTVGPRRGHTAALRPEVPRILRGAPLGRERLQGGWVTARFEAADEIPLDMLEQWLDESYRAIAPKKLLAQLDGES